MAEAPFPAILCGTCECNLCNGRIVHVVATGQSFCPCCKAIGRCEHWAALTRVEPLRQKLVRAGHG